MLFWDSTPLLACKSPRHRDSTSLLASWPLKVWNRPYVFWFRKQEDRDSPTRLRSRHAEIDVLSLSLGFCGQESLYLSSHCLGMGSHPRGAVRPRRSWIFLVLRRRSCPEAMRNGKCGNFRTAGLSFFLVSRDVFFSFCGVGGGGECFMFSEGWLVGFCFLCLFFCIYCIVGLLSGPITWSPGTVFCRLSK